MHHLALLCGLSALCVEQQRHFSSYKNEVRFFTSTLRSHLVLMKEPIKAKSVAALITLLIAQCSTTSSLTLLSVLPPDTPNPKSPMCTQLWKEGQFLLLGPTPSCASPERAVLRGRPYGRGAERVLVCHGELYSCEGLPKETERKKEKLPHCKAAQGRDFKTFVGGHEGHGPLPGR